MAAVSMRRSSFMLLPPLGVLTCFVSFYHEMGKPQMEAFYLNAGAAPRELQKMTARTFILVGILIF